MYDLLLYVSLNYSVLSSLIGTVGAYFTRSKTVTRFPTGDSREFPSGVKRRLPLLYTVPRRLENCGTSSATVACAWRMSSYPEIRFHNGIGMVMHSVKFNNSPLGILRLAQSKFALTLILFASSYNTNPFKGSRRSSTRTEI